jgi:hypothetical protein
MVLSCGEILIVFEDRELQPIQSVDMGHQTLDVEVRSKDRNKKLSIQIISNLTFRQKIQAIIVHTIARITFDPAKIKDATPLNYVPQAVRIKDYEDGYWENLISNSNVQINLDENMIIGYGLIN